jgi:Putative phage tail protein
MLKATTMAADALIIQGRGGGGGKGGGARVAVEEKDSLRSIQFAEVLDLICEGEVEGLVNGMKSVYLDKVPLQNADNSFNFEGVQFAFTKGTQGQAALPGFSSVQNEVAVGVQVLQSTPIVRTITNPDTARARVTISIPQLTLQNTSNGDIGGFGVEFAIDVQANGGGYVEKYRTTITGKTTTKYQRAVLLDLTGAAPWDIRVRRISAPPAGSNEQNQTWWDSYTEIQTVKLRYPNSVVHGLRVSAQQYSRIPERAYDMLMLRCQVPVNYDPITRTYTGAWNGTFKIAWTNNPAWAMYDITTNERYGLGGYIDAAALDKWQLYTIAQVCDEMVSDGRGGMQPRYTCNVLFQTREEAFKVLQDLAAIFRGAVFWGAGNIQFTQDAPAPVAMQFTPANVVEGDFSYASTSSTATRHSVAIVYWNNPAEFFRRTPEVVVNDELVAKIGIREIELSPIGITSRGQAARIGRWALYSEDREAETVAFKTGLEGAGLRIGQVFTIADPHEAGERLGGRIAASTASAVTIDAPATLNLGESYTLTVTFPDADQPLGYRTEERSVTNGAGLHSTINVSPAFSAAPDAQTIWMLASNMIAPTYWRALSVREITPTEFEITGVAHDPSKYALIENGLVLESRPTTRLSDTPLKPLGPLVFNEVLYIDRSTYKSRLSIGWLPPAGYGAAGLRYKLSWRFELGAWTNLTEITDQTIDLSGLDPGLVEVKVRSYNALGVESLALEGSVTLLGKFAPPQAVINVALTQDLVFWKTVTDVDVIYGGGYEVRVAAGTTGPNVTWARATPINDGLVTDVPYKLPVRLYGLQTVFVAAVDSSGKVGEAGSASLDFGPVPTDNIAQTRNYQAEGWPGIITGGAVGFGVISADADASNNIYALGDVYSEPDIYGGLWNALAYESELFTTLYGGTTLTLDSGVVGNGAAVEYRLLPDFDVYAQADVYALGSVYGELGAWLPWPGALVLPAGAAIQWRLSAEGGTQRAQVTTLTVYSVAKRGTQSFTSVAMSAAGTRFPPGAGNPPYNWIAGGVRGVQVTPIGAITGTVVGARVIDFDSTNGPLAVLVDGSGAAIAGSATIYVEGLINV